MRLQATGGFAVRRSEFRVRIGARRHDRDDFIIRSYLRALFDDDAEPNLEHGTAKCDFANPESGIRNLESGIWKVHSIANPVLRPHSCPSDATA